MRGDRLLVRRRPVAEELALVRSHLEEAEVLAVLCGRPEVRLAPGDGDRGVAVVRERVADRRLRRERARGGVRRAPAPSSGVPRRSSRAGGLAARRIRRFDCAWSRFAVELRSERWVRKKWIAPRYLRSAASLRSSCWSRVECRVCRLRLASRGRTGPSSLPQRPASRERTQAGQRVGLSERFTS